MRKIIALFSLFISPIFLYSHDGKTHKTEVLDVFGFEENPEIESWVNFISSKAIDDWQSFYSNIQDTYNFHKISVGNHRVFFHWGYDSTPWNDAIEKKLEEYCDSYDLNLDTYIRIFKTEFKTENDKRKRNVDDETMRLFGVDPNDGSIEAEYVKFFRNMVYNIHILGDYTTTNLEGLMPLDSVVVSISKEIKRLEPKLKDDEDLYELRNKRLKLHKITSFLGVDKFDLYFRNSAQKLGEYIIDSLSVICPENIKTLNSEDRNEVIENMFELLKKELPRFIKKASGETDAKKGTVKRWLEERGFVLKADVEDI